MDLGAQGGAKRRNQTQSDGKIFAEDSDCTGEVPIRTKVMKLYKCFFFSNFRIGTMVEI